MDTTVQSSSASSRKATEDDAENDLDCGGERASFVSEDNKAGSGYSESECKYNSEGESPVKVNSPLFAQSSRDKDKLAIFRASNRQMKEQKKASLKAAIDESAQKEAQRKEYLKRGLDGNSNVVFEQLKKEKTEIGMQVIDHKSERLKRAGHKMLSKKGDEFYNMVGSMSMSKKQSELQRACWEVTNFVPLKFHSSTQRYAAAQQSQLRDKTEDPTVLKALMNLFSLLDGFSDQSGQFLSMLCEDSDVAVITVPAGTRAATKGLPMTRSLVLLSGQAHNLSYAGESFILLEESQSTRMRTGDCLGFMGDTSDNLAENNAFTIICQTDCSFLEISKSTFDQIYDQIKFERFLVIMNMNPEDRADTDVEFLLKFAKKNAFFQQLKDSRQLNLCRQSRMEQYKFEDVLFNEDDRGQTYYIIIRGSVRVLKNVGGALDNQGNKIFQQVALLSQGVGFGELALLSSSGVRQATVVANENSVFMTLSRKTYNEVLRGEHEHSLQETIRAITHVFPYLGQRDKIFQTYIAQLFREEELPAGHDIFKQGDKASTFYILKEGALETRCRVEFSRLSPPEKAGLNIEASFETKTLKKFTDKEHKSRVIHFGILSTFGDTIGDIDMLADPIWLAKYMYTVTVMKPAVLCSISWNALKVRFPPEMLEELQTRLKSKLSLFKNIFSSAVTTECSNTQFSCLTNFNPTGYVAKELVDERLKSTVKMSLGDQLEEKKSKIRRNIRSRMDVLPAEAFQTTVNEWIVDMSTDKVLQSIETATERLAKNTGVSTFQTDTSKPWLVSDNSKTDKTFHSVMRSEHLDEQNIESCIENIIKTTRCVTDRELASSDIDHENSTTSHRIAMKSAGSGETWPKCVTTPIPGHKPQFYRYDLTEKICNVVQETIESVGDFVLLDASIHQTRPATRATMTSSSSKSRQSTKTRRGFDFTVGSSGDESENMSRRANVSRNHDVYSSDASVDLSFTRTQIDDREEIPEYFYPDHYRVKTSKNHGAKHIFKDFRNQREAKLRVRSATAMKFDSAVIATPIKSQQQHSNIWVSSPLLPFIECVERSQPRSSDSPLPAPDVRFFTIKSLQKNAVSSAKPRVLEQTQSAFQFSLADSTEGVAFSNLPDSGLMFRDESTTGNESMQKHQLFCGEKDSTCFTDPSNFLAPSASYDSDEQHGIDGNIGDAATCSPDFSALAISSPDHQAPATQSTVQLEPNGKHLTKEEKFKDILKTGFVVAHLQDEKSTKLQLEEVERLKLAHALAEKEKTQTETKLKLQKLYSSGLLNKRIQHLDAKLEQEQQNFQLSAVLLEKMNDTIVRRMNDADFSTMKFNIKLPKASKTENLKKMPAANPTLFNFNGFDHTLCNKSVKYEDAVKRSYHNEQMLKIQNRNNDQKKAERQQLLKNVLSKTNRVSSIAGSQLEGTALPDISASPPQHRR
jgi:CRP-like cAMP-binding protein